jgi:predicted GTPase
MNALRIGFNRLISSRQALVRSTGDTLRDRKSSLASHSDSPVKSPDF